MIRIVRKTAMMFLVLAAVGFLVGPAPATSAPGSETAPPITLTVLYSNTTAVPGTQADRGFSCLIRGTEKTILLDAGMKPEVLFHNLEVLKVDPKEVQVIAISHAHLDHTGCPRALRHQTR